MKISRLFLVAMIFGSTFAAGEELQGTKSQEKISSRVHRFQPCQFWRSDVSTGLYSCSMTGYTISVSDAQDVAELKTLVTQLAAKVEDLENRVRVLEGNP